MKEWILSTKGSLCIILLIWLFNSCILKVKYASLHSIFKNYFKCFKSEAGKVLIAPLVNYFVLPVLLAGVVVREKIIDSSIIAVSYTHLDVYKRQGGSCGGIHSVFDGRVYFTLL